MKRIVRRKYTAFALSVVCSDVTCSQIITEVVRRVKQELKNFISDTTASLLTEALKRFSWKTVHLEMRRNIPTLMSWLSAIVPARSDGASALYAGSTTFEIKAHEQFLLCSMVAVLGTGKILQYIKLYKL